MLSLTANDSQTVATDLVETEQQQMLLRAPVAAWDRGQEILPAAYLAAEEINERSNVLSGRLLEIVPVNAELCECVECSRRYNAQGSRHRSRSHLGTLVRFLQSLPTDASLLEPFPSEPVAAVGVTGLFCSAVAHALAPVASHPGISRGGIVQIAGTTSPSLSKPGRSGPLLYQVLPDSSVYARVALGILQRFNWSRIGVLYASEEAGIDRYYIPTAEAFMQGLGESGTASDTRRTVDVALVRELDLKSTSIPNALRDVQNHGVKILFVFAPLEITVALLRSARCSLKDKLLWPDYAWILHDRSIEDYIAATKTDFGYCEGILNGVMLVNYSLGSFPVHPVRNSDTSKVLSSLSRANPYANVMYDSVRALGLAFDSYLHDDTRSLIEEVAKFSYYNGASASSSNSRTLSIDVYFISTPSTVSLAGYYSFASMTNRSDGMTWIDSVFNSSKFPDDSLEMKYVKIGGLVFTVFVLLAIIPAAFTTVCMFLILYYRKKPGIKAASPYISLCVFAGCYLLHFAVLVDALSRIFVIQNGARSVVCGAIIGPVSVGYTLILSTLLVRLVRISHIFNNPSTRNTIHWKDSFLGLEIALITAGNTAIVMVWFLSDNYVVADEISTIQTSDGYQYLQAQQYCTSNYVLIWYTLALGYVGVLMLLLGIYAYKTRKIRKREFKDTKKINAYISLMTMVISIGIPLWWVVRLFDYTVSGLIICAVYVLVAVFCQVLLFFPKVYPFIVKFVKR